MGMHGFCWLFWSSIGWSSGFWVHNPLCGSGNDQFNWSGTDHPRLPDQGSNCSPNLSSFVFGHLGPKAIFILCFASIWVLSPRMLSSWLWSIPMSLIRPWSGPRIRGHNQTSEVPPVWTSDNSVKIRRSEAHLFGLRTTKRQGTSWTSYATCCTKPVKLQLDFFK